MLSGAQCRYEYVYAYTYTYIDSVYVYVYRQSTYVDKDIDIATYIDKGPCLYTRMLSGAWSRYVYVYACRYV